MNHCRIRLGLSHFNSHLHHYNLIDSPSCSNPECGRTPESTAHYFLSCPRYNNERRVLFESLSRKLFPNVNYNTFIVLMFDHICTILLEGSEDASYEENTSIFDEVFKYIVSTQRFSTFEDMFDTSTDNQLLVHINIRVLSAAEESPSWARNYNASLELGRTWAKF